MKVFAIAFEYEDGKVIKGELGVVYIEAETEEEAKRKCGRIGIVAVKEMSLDEFVSLGLRREK